MQASSPSGKSIGTVAFHALKYDPVDNVFLFLTDYRSGWRMWAYRYTQSPEGLPSDLPASPPSGPTALEAH